MNPFRIRRDQPLFDIGSYARAGPAVRRSLTAAEIMRISRTVAGTSEVMVKVTSGNGSKRLAE